MLGALRALPAGLLLLLVKPSLPKKGEWRTLFILGTVNIATFFGLIFVMAQTLPSTISGVGMVSVPVFAMLYQWLVNRKRPSWLQTLSGFALVLFAFFLFSPGSISLNPIGLGAMLAAIMCIVVGSGMTKTLGSRIHWWTILTWQLILGGAVLSLASGFHAALEPQLYVSVIDNFSTQNLVGLLWVVGLNTALSYGMYVWLLQRMSVVDFTFGGIANPIAGIVCGMVLLGESFTQTQYALMIGMIMMSLVPQTLQAVKQHRLASLAKQG
ncbi:metabolite transporter (DMT) superfamily [Vibrio maritimus]|uniref:Metabolite transporter (DMT) superfamily n=1 Tax=Vibrio maritimus TaxID=990268 RepID=A0A090T5I7_9VIBR|nr:metabolite transporter (DMT) superfamily [Vibrio maritimus]